jgi:malate synthase
MPLHFQNGSSALLSAEAVAFLTELHARFGGRRTELLARRRERTTFDFLVETASVRAGSWRVAAPPEIVADRRVEITGPVEPKMIINALNSGANVFMADFEDSLAPTWANVMTGHQALSEAVRGTLAFTSPEGKAYRLGQKAAVLFVRPRGWHLSEAHVTDGGVPISASLFDFGLFAFHNAREQLRRGAGPFFYLPKLESHLEARLWNEVFAFTEAHLQLPTGSVKATVLIETLPAAFEMEEILYELKDRSLGLNCGRWDYLFSFIKCQPERLLPDRGQLTMSGGFLRAYSQRLIQTCHRRGAHAMGGMAAVIPIKGDEAANEAALAKVRADKLREVTDGHDGTWVAHPGLVAVAKAVFDQHMPGPNQLARTRDDVVVTRDDLLRIPEGTRTEEGLRHNLRIGVQYIEAWLRGQGCVPLNHLMEDAATAEISRAQVWQWLASGQLSVQRYTQLLSEETGSMSGGRFAEAKALFTRLVTSPSFEPFLTTPAYQLITTASQGAAP